MKFIVFYVFIYRTKVLYLPYVHIGYSHPRAKQAGFILFIFIKYKLREQWEFDNCGM